MLELAERLLPILRAGERVAAVSVMQVMRSAPHGVGSTMAVTQEGVIVGSISGGCVESDSVVLARSVLGDGVARTARFGFSDHAAHAAGLACGGAIQVIAYELDAGCVEPLESAVAGTSVSLGVVTSGREIGRIIDDPRLFTPSVVAGRENALVPGAYTAAAHRPLDLLVLSRAPRPRLIIVGAGEHGAALCRLAAAAGYAVTVCDAWEPLVTASRFPDADELVVAFPDEYLSSLNADDVDARTAICVLTHDERLDVPALRVALDLPVGFVGAMGARSTAARRAALLAEQGVEDAALRRLHSPLGLDLGASTPPETALSILAEITAARCGGSGSPLRDLTGPMHHRPAGDPDDTAASGSCWTTRTAREL